MLLIDEKSQTFLRFILLDHLIYRRGVACNCATDASLEHTSILSDMLFSSGKLQKTAIVQTATSRCNSFQPQPVYTCLTPATFSLFRKKVHSLALSERVERP